MLLLSNKIITDLGNFINEEVVESVGQVFVCNKQIDMNMVS